MKKILLIVFVLFSINSYGQYNNNKGWKSPELYLPATVLVSTFVVNDYMMNNEIGSKKQTALIAAIGMAISLATHFIFKKIRTNARKNRNIIIN